MQARFEPRVVVVEAEQRGQAVQEERRPGPQARARISLPATRSSIDPGPAGVMEARIAAPDATRIGVPEPRPALPAPPEIDRTVERQRALERIRTSTTTSLTSLRGRCNARAGTPVGPLQADFE